MEILLLPVLFMYFLYLIFQCVRKKKSPFLTLLWMALAVGGTMLAAFFLAVINSSYLGQKEWSQEKQFFFHLFADKLESSGDLKTAATFMQTAEVKQQILDRIHEIVESFRPKTLLFLSLGGFVLLLATASLWFRIISVPKYYPYILLLVVVIGAMLLDMGVYYRHYALGTDKRLTNFLRCQQELMKDLSELKTDMNIPDMIKIIRHEAENTSHGYGQKLMTDLR